MTFWKLKGPGIPLKRKGVPQARVAMEKVGLSMYIKVLPGNQQVHSVHRNVRTCYSEEMFLNCNTISLKL